MKDILLQSNFNLLKNLDRLESLLDSTQTPMELHIYKEWMSLLCERLRDRIMQNLQDLKLNRDEILIDILSNTQEITRSFKLYDQHLSGPVLRSLPSDRLCLKFIRWLHIIHTETKDLPAGISNGDLRVAPLLEIPTVYFIPSSAQHSLLFLPLLIHEFGHLLYTCHKEGLDYLTRDLQSKIADLLRPIYQRNDSHFEEEINKCKRIVEAWYGWLIELFCDALGLMIGGPCFANAFSFYLRMDGREVFYLPRENLINSWHPVSWIRIHLIADRTRQLGCKAEAERLEKEWNTIAKTMQIKEDYYGFYDKAFLPIILKTLNQMLDVVSPYKFRKEDISSHDCNPELLTPIQLLNCAWNKFLNDPSKFLSWEEKAISVFLTTDYKTFG